MKFRSKQTYLLLGSGLLFTGLLIGWILFYGPFYGPKNPKIIDIPKGSSVTTISEILKKHHIVSRPFLFKLYVKLSGQGGQLRAGSFMFKPGYSLSGIVNILTLENGVASYIKITIPEGFKLSQIAERLGRHQLVSPEAFLDYVGNQAKADFVQEFSFLEEAPTHNLEGYFFPNTYYFSKDDDSVSIVRALLSEFSNKMLPIWEGALTTKGSMKSRFSFHEVLTLASIVQMEARIVDEMPTIASVFNNRLLKRMPLAADPTVVYGLGVVRKDLVTYADTRVSSPYNTYINTGFPPTPIASPGTRALEAALNPIKTNYLFFVAAPDGSHKFTTNYKAHLRVQNQMKRNAR